MRWRERDKRGVSEVSSCLVLVQMSQWWLEVKTVCCTSVMWCTLLSCIAQALLLGQINHMNAVSLLTCAASQNALDFMFPPLISLPIKYMAHHCEMAHRCPCNCLLLEPGCEQINAQMKLSITSQPPTILSSVRFYLVLPVALENIVLNSGAEKYLHHSPLQRPPLVNKSYISLKYPITQRKPIF